MGKNLKGKELGKGVTQREDGDYCARYVDCNGKRIQRRFKTLAECKNWLAKCNQSVMINQSKGIQDMPVQDWYQIWIEMKEKTTCAATTDNYKRIYRNDMQPVFGKMNMGDIKAIHCQTVLIKMADRGCNNGTIELTRTAMANFFSMAVDNDIIEKTPCKKSVKSKIGEPCIKREGMTREEQHMLLTAISGHKYETQFRFALQTGLRVGEISGLCWEDVDFEKRVLTIKHNLTYRLSLGWEMKDPKTISGIRTVPLTDEAISLLQYQKKFNDTIRVIPLEWTGLVFLGANGLPPHSTTYDMALGRACEGIGLKKVSMHILRHTFATRCIEAGMSPKTLQTILGHRKIAVTMDRYVTVTEGQKQKEIKLVESALLAV